MAIKITREEYERKFGQAPDFSTATAKPIKDDGYVKSTIKEAFNSGLSTIKGSFETAKKAESPLQAIESGIEFGQGVAQTLASPLAPAFKPVGKAIEYTADKISDNPSVQKFASSKAGQITERVAKDVGGLADIAGLATSPKAIGRATNVVGSSLDNVGTSISKTGSYAKNVARDIVPTSGRFMESQVSKALDLTPGDLSNIAKSTGNDVGRWMADNNLIGVNKESTQANLSKFYEQNYSQVRSEISKVKIPYKQSQVPRYVEALKQIKKQVDDVPGLQEVSVEVNRLLDKKNPTLTDVQRVKELMDEHFNLYKVTGDVSEATAKQGLANIRSEIRSFIEAEVEKTTKVDIGPMNNNVSTAKSTLNAIETRSPKGLTRSNIRIGDLGILGVGWGVGGPLTGVALLFGKKILESPTVRLRMAKYIDQFSDAQKAKMAQELENGKIPQELQRFVKQKESTETKKQPI